MPYNKVNSLKNLLGNVDSFQHFVDELLSLEFFIHIEVLRELFFEDGVPVLRRLDIVLALTPVEAVAPKETGDLFGHSLLVNLQREGLLERCYVQLDQELVKLFVHLLIENNLSPELKARVAIIHLVYTIDVLANRFICEQQLAVVVTHTFHFPL